MRKILVFIVFTMLALLTVGCANWSVGTTEYSDGRKETHAWEFNFCHAPVLTGAATDESYPLVTDKTKAQAKRIIMNSTITALDKKQE